MKQKFILLLIMLLCPLLTMGQSIQYTYDSAGNRTARTSNSTRGLVTLSAPAAAVASVAAVASATTDELTYVTPSTYTLNKSLSVGHTPYTFQVNPNGSSSFSIPLAVPEGMNGMTPNLSIDYNSQAGEGVLGYGMTLSCLSSITRTAPRSYYEGRNADFVSLSNATHDGFSLDGMRLIYNPSPQYYLKEVDDLSRITSHYSALGDLYTYFLVQQKDGRKLYYGDYVSNASQRNAGSDSNARIAWYLNVEEDEHGNRITYNYGRDTSNSDIWLESIVYRVGGSQHTNTIRFSYANYSNAYGGYFMGYPVKRQKILKEITMNVDEEVVRRYSFDYIRSTEKLANPYPRLYTITEYGRGGTQALNPMRIEWGDIGEQLFKETFFSSQHSDFISGDFDGDGCTDLLSIIDVTPENSSSYNKDYQVYYRKSSKDGFGVDIQIATFVNQTNPVKAITGDFDGDGLDDIIFATGAGYEYWKSVAHSGYITIEKQTYAPTTAPYNSEIFCLADVDGDGKDELVIDGYYYNVESNSPVGFTIPSMPYFQGYLMGDVNNDNCQDLIIYDRYLTVKAISPNKNSVILTLNLLKSSFQTQNCYLFGGYFNNDQHFDLLLIEGYLGSSSSTDENYLYLNKGDGTFEEVDVDLLANSPLATFHPGDFNGDGLTDILIVETGALASDIADGVTNTEAPGLMDVFFAPYFSGRSLRVTDFYRSPELGSGTPGTNGVYRYNNKLYLLPDNYYALAADFTGDGKCDVVGVCEFPRKLVNPSYYDYLTRTTGLKLYSPHHHSTNDVVTGIRNGDGTVRNIVYSHLNSVARTPNYHNGTNASWNKLVNAFNTVAQVTLGSVNDAALMENSSYTFSTPIYVRRDRQLFLGFQNVVKCDSLSGYKQTDLYTKTGYIGIYVPFRSTRSYNGQSHSNIDYGYSVRTTYYKYGFLYLNSMVEMNNMEGNTRKQTSYTYDSFGNPTRKHVYMYSSGIHKYTDENMTYITCSSLSAVRNRMATYQKKYYVSGDTIVEPQRNFTYDSKGQLLTATEHEMTRRYSYNSYGMPQNELQQSGNATRATQYSYNFANYATTQTGPTGEVTVQTRDCFGNVLTETTPDGRCTTYEYDSFGRLQKTISPEGVETVCSYAWASANDLAGGSAIQKQSVSYAGTSAMHTFMDCYGRTLLRGELQSGGRWQWVRNSYNPAGLLSKEEVLHGTTALTAASSVEYSYDNFQRIGSEHHQSSNQTTLDKQIDYSYSALRQIVRTLTDQEHVDTLMYDMNKNLLWQADGMGKTVYTYDVADRLTSVSGAGYPVTIGYDQYHRVTHVHNPSSGNTTYQYNGFDEVIKQIDGNGKQVSYTYLPTGRVGTMSDGSRSLTYTYNNKGQLLSEGESGNNFSYGYNSAGLLQTEVKSINGVSLTKRYTYDSRGRLSTYTSPSGLVLAYAYDASDNLTAITDQSTGSKLWEAKSYAESGQIATEAGVGGRITTFTYDQTGRITGISNNLASFGYGYNQGGQLTSRTEQFGSVSLTENFVYDNQGNLIQSTPVGKTAVTVGYNPGRSISSKSDVGSYGYHGTNKRMTQVTTASGLVMPANHTLTYNNSNRPASVSGGGYTRSYLYDAHNGRTYSELTTVNSNPLYAPCKRYYFGDYERFINTNNNVVSNIDYIFAHGRLVALVRTSGSSKDVYGVLTDRQGSLRALYNASGVVQRFSYDAWGNRRSISGGSLTDSEKASLNSITSRGYTLHEHMDEFGLINMNARLYDPQLGMFVSTDPKASDYYNTYPYSYCSGDPLNRVDPTGESTWVVSNGDGTYKIIGGDITDDDLGIYEFSFQLGALAITPIGESLTITSFYDTDANNGEGAWQIGSVIDPKDDSGILFLEEVQSSFLPLFSYILKAGNGGDYDFKVTNGNDVTNNTLDIYRGMPMGEYHKELPVYASARDIGNYAAGYKAAVNMISWPMSRKAFDIYQSRFKFPLNKEGKSTQNAEFEGWKKGNSVSVPMKLLNFAISSIPLVNIIRLF